MLQSKKIVTECFFMEFCRVYFSRWFFGSFQKEEKEGRRHGKREDADFTHPGGK